MPFTLKWKLLHVITYTKENTKENIGINLPEYTDLPHILILPIIGSQSPLIVRINTSISIHNILDLLTKIDIFRHIFHYTHTIIFL